MEQHFPDMQQKETCNKKKGLKRIEMIIKMVNKFKLTIIHFACLNSMQICACMWIYH